MAGLMTYEIRVRGQVPREVVCSRVLEENDQVEFWVDDTLLVFKASVDDVIWWQLKKPKGRRPGVKRVVRAAPVAWAFKLGETLGRRSRDS